MNKKFKKIGIKIINILMVMILIGGILPMELFATAIEEGITTIVTPDKEGEKTPDKEGEKTPDKEGEKTPDKEGEKTPSVEEIDPEKEATKYITKPNDGKIDNPLVGKQKATEVDFTTNNEVEINVEYEKNNSVKRSFSNTDFVTETKDFEVVSKKEIDTVFTQKRNRRSLENNKINDEILSNDEVLKMLGIKVNTKIGLRSSPGYIDTKKIITISEDERSNLTYARQLSNSERYQVINLRIDDPMTNKRTTIPINFRLKGERALRHDSIVVRGTLKSGERKHAYQLDSTNDKVAFKMKFSGSDAAATPFDIKTCGSSSIVAKIYGNYQPTIANYTVGDSSADTFKSVYDKARERVSVNNNPVERKYRAFGFWNCPGSDKIWVGASGYRKLGFSENTTKNWSPLNKMYFVSDPNDPSIESYIEVANPFNENSTVAELDKGLDIIRYSSEFPAGANMNEFIKKKKLVEGQYLPGTKNWPDFKPTKNRAKFVGWAENDVLLPDSYTVVPGAKNYKPVFDNEVIIPDPVLKKELVKALGKTAGSEIYESETLTLTSFIYEKNGQEKITNLEGIQYFKNLTILKLKYNNITNVSPIATLTKLSELSMPFNSELINIEPLKNLVNLTMLWVDSTKVNDISHLSKLVKLKMLNIAHTSVSDISVVRNFTNLETFYTRGAKIYDITPLDSLNLKQFSLDKQRISGEKIITVDSYAETLNMTKDLKGNKVTPTNDAEYDYNTTTGKVKFKKVINSGEKSYSFTLRVTIGGHSDSFNGVVTHYIEKEAGVNIPDLVLKKELVKALGKSTGSEISFEEAKTLTKFAYDGQDKEKISNLEGLQYFSNLTSIEIIRNEITDLTPLSRLNKLTNLYVGDNHIVNVEPLKDLVGLTTLRIDWNRIVDLSPLSKLVNLTTLDLNTMLSLKDISVVRNFTKLENLSMNDTSISSIESLSGLKKLKYLRAQNNQIFDISPLKTLPLINNIKISNQKITGEKLISYGPEIEVLNKTIDVNGNKVVPTNSADYDYNSSSKKVKFKNIVSSGEKSYSFTIENQIGTVNTTFNGTVTHNIELNQGINIPDPVLKKELLKALGKPENFNISPEEALTLREFSYDGLNKDKIENLEGLDKFSNLKNLSLPNNNITNGDVLGNIALEIINLDDNKIESIWRFQYTNVVKSISINRNKISNIEQLNSIIRKAKVSLLDQVIEKNTKTIDKSWDVIADPITSIPSTDLIKYSGENFDQVLPSKEIRLHNINGSKNVVLTARGGGVILCGSNPETREVCYTATIKLPYKVMRNFTFDTQGGTWSGETSQVLEVGTQFSAQTLTSPTKEGYSFIGWQYNNGTNLVDYDLKKGVPSFDANFVAKWEGIERTNDFDTDGGSTNSKVITRVGQKVNKPVNPEKPGYAFNRWVLVTGSTENEFNFETELQPNHNLKFKAKYDPKEVTVKFINNRKSDESEDIFITTKPLVGQVIVTPGTTPVYEGYIFKGWSKNPDYNSSSYDFNTIIKEKDVLNEIKLYAMWEAIDKQIISKNPEELIGSGDEKNKEDIRIPIHTTNIEDKIKRTSKSNNVLEKTEVEFVKEDKIIGRKLVATGIKIKLEYFIILAIFLILCGLRIKLKK